jgi:hypothetical protein
VSSEARRIAANPGEIDEIAGDDRALAGIIVAWPILPAKAKTAILSIIQMCTDSS